MTRSARILKQWWPVPAFIAGSVMVQILTRPHPTPVGHAAGHYGNATVLFAIAPAVAITVWAGSADVRRRPTFWLLNTAVVASTVVVYAANMRIVNAVAGERWSDDQAGLLGPTRPGFEAGHVLTERAEWFSATIVIVIALCLGRWHALKPGAVVAVVVASIILPPWFMLPGHGIVIIAIAFVRQRARRLGPQHVDTRAERWMSRRVGRVSK